MRYKAVAALAALAALTAPLVLALPAGAAGNAGTTQVTTFDPTGAVFTCPDASYTVLGGTVRSVFHDSVAANGSRLAGASWFGGNFNPATGKDEFTDTEFFNILGPSGGVVARVAGVEHMGTGGSNFSFSFGECEAPQD